MENKKGTINQYNLMGIVFQFVVTIVVIIFGILSIFNNKYYLALEIAIAIDLFIMAYNNQKVYHKKNITIIYLVVAVGMLISSILSMLGVI